MPKAAKMKSKTRVIISKRTDKRLPSLLLMLIITALLTTIHSVSLSRPSPLGVHEEQIRPISTPLPAANPVHALMARRESVTALALANAHGKYTATWQVNTAGQLEHLRRLVQPSLADTHTEHWEKVPEVEEESGSPAHRRTSDLPPGQTNLALYLSGYHEGQNSNLKFNVGDGRIVGFKSNFRTNPRVKRDTGIREPRQVYERDSPATDANLADFPAQQIQQPDDSSRVSGDSVRVDRRFGLFKRDHRYNSAPLIPYGRLNVDVPYLTDRYCERCLSSAGLTSSINSAWMLNTDSRQYPLYQIHQGGASTPPAKSLKFKMHKFQLHKPLFGAQYHPSYQLGSKFRLPNFSSRLPTRSRTMNPQPYNCITSTALLNNRLTVSEPTLQASGSNDELKLLQQMDFSDV